MEIMAKKMLIDATHAEETRVVVVEGNKVEEFDFESENRRQLAGNIYLAKVTRIEPSLQAAFIDYGGNRHGFLAFSEIHPDYYQIPVADREALMEEERAFSEALRRKDDEEESDELLETVSQNKEEVLEEEFMILYEDMCCEWQLDMNDPDSTFLTEEAIDENIVNKVMDLHKNINAKKAKHMIATAQSMGLDPVKIQMYLSAILPTMTTLAANYEPEDEVIEDAPANSMGGGAIAGSAEAGDDPPVRKKKKKGDPMQILARSGIKEHLRVFPSQNIL